jgi:hypothetical protein
MHGSLLKHKLARRRELDLNRQEQTAPPPEADRAKADEAGPREGI